jgi:hypothetical protein
VFVHVFPFILVLVQKAENPRLTGNRGFLKIVCSFRISSHDAQKPGVALPTGHAANDRRVLQHLCCDRGFHLLPAIRNTISIHLSKFFCRKKMRCGMAAWC